LHTTIALVARDLSVALSNLIETNRVAIFNLVDLKEVLMSLRILNWLTLSRGIFNIVNITFVISLCAQTWNTHSGPFELLTIVAFGFLLSSYVGDLLSKEAFVGATMTTIIVRGPELEV
jgi:hypothetical protein